MEHLTTTIERFFKREEIKFERTEYPGVFQLAYRGDNGCFHGYVEADEDERSVRIEMYLPLIVAEDRRVQVAELLARINQGEPFSTLQLDMDDGWMTCRTGVFLGQSNLHHDIMEHLLLVNWYTADNVFPVILAVVLGHISPKAAAESGWECPPESDCPKEENGDTSLSDKVGEIWRNSMN